MRNVRWGVVPVALATAAFSLTLGVTSGAAKNAPVKVGIVTEKTGIFSAYAEEWLQGVHVGLAYATHGTGQVNGHRIALSVVDDADNPTTAATDFKSFVGAGDKIIGGTVDSSIAMELGPLAQQNKVLYISGPAAADQVTGLNRYTFRSGRQTYQDVQAAKSYIKQLGPGKTVLVLAQDFAFGQSYVADTTSACGSLGDTLKTMLGPLTTTDFTPVALQVAALHPDIVFLAWAGTTGAPLAQALDQQGIFASAKVITGLANIATYQFYGTAGLKFYYLSLYNWQSAHTKVDAYLIKGMRADYHQYPDLFTADGFVWAQMVVRAIQTGQGTNVSKMIKGLEGWKFQAPKGLQQIRAADHAMLQPMFQVQLVSTVTGVYRPVLLNTLSSAQTAPPVSAHFGS